MIPQIHFHNLNSSESLAQAIHDRTEKLTRLSANIIRCDVTVEVPHRHHKKGWKYRVSVHATTPAGEICVTSEHEDVYLAVRDVFDVARRQLRHQLSKRRGDVKRHAA